jgi:hypothetical protein
MTRTPWPFFRLLFCATITISTFARTPSDLSPVSCSIDGIADYSRTLPFCDLTRQTRIFGSAQAPYDGNCSVDSDGWPTQSQFGLVFITLPAGAPPVGVLIDGIYTLLFEGNASLTFPASVATLINQTFDGVYTTAFVNVPFVNSGQLWIGWQGATMMGGTVVGAKNISLLQPGCSVNDIFALSPNFVSLTSRFDSLRFMDWAHTNNSPETEWVDRRTLNNISFATSVGNTVGVPWEMCAKLVNTVQRDMWINIPAQASDDYVLQLARLLFVSVDPSLNIYYEYSNEVWNWQFRQATYSLEAANTSVMVDGDPFHFNYDLIDNPGYWQWRRTAYMAKHVADIFKTVFGNESVGSGKRVRPLLCGQVSSPIVVDQGLMYLESVWGAPKTFLHGLCGAPYFGLPTRVNNNPNITLDDVFSGFDETIYNQSLAFGVDERNSLAVHVALAYHYGLEFRAYEGGPDTSGPNLGPTYLGIKGNATVDSRIQQRVETYLTQWYQYGRVMGPLNYFVAGASNLIDQYGVYGILSDMRLPNMSYKLKGVDAVRASARPPTPTDTIKLVPFVANCSADAVGARVPDSPPYHCDYFGANTTFDFFLQTTAPSSTISATVFVSTPWDNATLSVQLNDAQEIIVSCPQTAKGIAWSPCNPALLDATGGVSVVRLRSIGWTTKFRTYSIANVSFVTVAATTVAASTF